MNPNDNDNAPRMTRNPFALATTDAGAVVTRPATSAASADAARAIAEVQASMMLAKANPRDPMRAMDRILNDCTRLSLAEDAVYQYSRGGTDISGASIRLAESIAQRWGNVKWGFRVLSRSLDHDGVSCSEVQAYALDLESLASRDIVFPVRHWRDTKGGGYALRDERDVYELIANMAQRRTRACLLSIIPGDVVDAATQQCEATLKAKADTSPEAMVKMVAAFGQFGVSKEQIERRIQRRIEAISAAQVVGLKRVFASLRDGMSEPGEWFEPIETTGDGAPATGAAADGSAVDRLKAAQRSKRAAKPATDAPPPPPAEPPAAAPEPYAPPPPPAADLLNVDPATGVIGDTGAPAPATDAGSDPAN